MIGPVFKALRGIAVALARFDNVEAIVGQLLVKDELSVLQVHMPQVALVAQPILLQALRLHQSKDSRGGQR